jgi:3-deoxy-D-manno-octulosonic-acid transferase
MINLLYNSLLTLGLILSSPFFALKIITASRYRRGLSQRLGIRCKGVYEKVADEKPLWIHAASVGEVLASLPIIEGIRQTKPELSILLSTMTATGNDMAKKRASGVRAITFFPLDHPWAVRRTISLVNPRAFLMAETEIWPNFLFPLCSSTAAFRLAPSNGISAFVSSLPPLWPQSPPSPCSQA